MAVAVEVVEIKEGWTVVMDGEVIETFIGDAGYLSAQVLCDLLTPPEAPAPAPARAPTVPAPTVPAFQEEVKLNPLPKQRDESYPFPPGIRCFWWPRTPGASVTGSYDGTYDPGNGDSLKVVIRKGTQGGYLVAHTRALRAALYLSGALPGDILTITGREKGFLLPEDRGPAQLFTIVVEQRCADRDDPYQPGRN